MPAEKTAREVPWITEDGFVDPSQFPIDSVLRQALSEDREESYSAITLLRSMYGHGRNEAGVFLIGLLMTSGDDWQKRIDLVGALQSVRTEACVELLFRELKRVKSTNSTRRYLKEVIDVLSCMPPTLVRPGFETLAADRSFTPRMRAEFRAALDEVDYREHHRC